MSGEPKAPGSVAPAISRCGVPRAISPREAKRSPPIKSSTSAEVSTRQLSRGACLLLALLQEARRKPGIAWTTDADVSRQEPSVPERDVIDHAYELLAHGFCVVARTADPAGRRLLQAGDDLQPALDNLAQLESRQTQIAARIRALRDCVARLRDAKPPRQEALFEDTRDPRRYLR